MDRKEALNVSAVLFAETHYTVYYCSRSLGGRRGQTSLMKILMTLKPKVELQILKSKRDFLCEL